MELKISGKDKKIRRILNINGNLSNRMKNKNNSSLDIASTYSKEDGHFSLQVKGNQNTSKKEAIMTKDTKKIKKWEKI